jgi:O-antigen/teichoic acid export membrane protein
MLPSQLVAANCLALLAPFVTLRTINWYLSTVAVFQQRDTARLGITMLALLVDVALLVGLAPLLGATAASLAAVGADVVLYAGFARTTGYRPQPLHFVSFIALAAAAIASVYVIHYPAGTFL